MTGRLGFSDELRRALAAERGSKATFVIEELDEDDDGALVELSVVHDDFDPGSTVAEVCREAGPRCRT